MANSPALGVPYVSSPPPAQAEVLHNSALNMLLALARGAITRGLDTPPGSPSDGDIYIIGTSPTDEWADKENKIAIWTATAWTFVPGRDSDGVDIPMGAEQAGLKIWVNDENTLYVWDGTDWIDFATSGGSFGTASTLDFDIDGTLAANSDAKIATQKAVKTFVETLVNGLIDSAPGALDTLNELAAALGDDASFASTVTTALAGKLALTGGTLSGALVVPDDAYDATGWNGSAQVPTKNAVRDVIEALIVGIPSGYTDEEARDAIGAALTDSGLAVVTVNDGGDTIDINVPAAIASDLNTGIDTTKAVTSDALAGSNFGKAVVTILVSDPAGSAITTGDGKAYYRVPSTLNGTNLVGVAAAVTTVSSSGKPTVQIHNVTDAVDMLTTKLEIDASETDSSTAGTAAVIDTAHDDVATGDMLRIDIDVAGTGAKGLIVEMQFQLP